MRPTFLAALAVATWLGGCAAVTVASRTAGAAITLTTTAVRGVVGAGTLVVRGATWGARQLVRDEDGFPAGTVVCLDRNGDPYAAAVVTGDQAVCPAPAR